MNASASSTTDWLRATLLRPGYADQPAQMRVSDAERNEVAERLGRHFSEGRLDQAEFDERVSRAMAAKTAGDFQGLFDDLPGEAPSGGPQAGYTQSGYVPGSAPRGAQAQGTPLGSGFAARRRRRGPVRMALLAVLVIIAANIAWHAVSFWIGPALWLVLIAAIIVVATKAARRTTR